MAKTVFRQSIMLVSRGHLGYLITGPFQQSAPSNGVVIYVSKAVATKAASKTVIALNHPPPPGLWLKGSQGSTGSEIELKNGDQVTIFPNGDIIIDKK